jgi:hypothetical protein
MTKRQRGRPGPPPSPGWWPVEGGYLRWWNGHWWSLEADSAGSVRDAAFLAKCSSFLQPHEVQWLPRPRSWPKRSRT